MRGSAPFLLLIAVLAFLAWDNFSRRREAAEMQQRINTLAQEQQKLRQNAVPAWFAERLRERPVSLEGGAYDEDRTLRTWTTTYGSPGTALDSAPRSTPSR